VVSHVRIWLWRLAAALGLSLVLLVTTARLTLLDANFDAQAIGRVDGYDRVYTEVLPSPAAQQALRQALAGLPVDPNYLASNVRLLLPPPVLRQLTQRLLADYVDVVLGRAGTINVDRALQPVADNLARLVGQLLPGTVATAPRLRAGSLSAFEGQVQTLVGQLDAGTAEPRLPTVALGPANVQRVTAILTAGLPPSQAAALAARVSPLLLVGDLSAAFAIVLPAYLDDSAVRALGIRADEGAHLLVDLLPAQVTAAAPHPVLPYGLGWLTALGGLLSVACLVPLLAERGQRARGLAISLGCSTAVALVVGWSVRAIAADPLRAISRGHALDPASRRLLADVDDQLRQGVSRTYLELTAVIALAALVSLVVSRATVTRTSSKRRLLLGSGSALLIGAILAVAAAPPSGSPRVCNGSARLCDRPYNEVTYLTSHNAMSSSDRGFLAAWQDLDIAGQLDNGVRALMLDLHYWTTPAEAAPVLAGLDRRTRAVLAPLVQTFEPHPGVWLCHELCQLGADSARAQLRALGQWLTDHPDDVVTLILEDNVSAADVQATVSAAGLDHRLATPPAPGEPWPTLQQMIRSGRTLAVFTQTAKLTTGPIRNFYQYAAETPFEADNISALSCQPGRGAATAPLFLVNNWVTATIPSRTQALATNGRLFLLDRVRRCEIQRNLRATFVAVDFTQVGQPLQVVDELNAVVPARADP
jgi:hypothetical protein